MINKPENGKTIQFIDELLYWIEVDCTGGPNEVAGNSIYSLIMTIILFYIAYFKQWRETDYQSKIQCLKQQPRTE